MSIYKTDKSIYGGPAELNFKTIKRIPMPQISIPDYCENKVVLSIGCVSAPTRIEEDINRGEHQFYNMTQKSKRAIGIDISKEGIKKLNELGMEAYYFDVFDINDNNPVKDIEFDILILSHVIEHVPNCWEFVKNVINKFKFKEIIVAVPSAYSSNSLLLWQMLYKERISNDHYYTFSPITFIRFLESLDIEVKDIFNTISAPPIEFGTHHKLKGLIIRIIANVNVKIFKKGHYGLLCIGTKK